MTEYTAHYDDILTLYKTGLSVGSNVRGAFCPNDTITRGAAAAMLTRMVDPALRLTPTWTVTTEPAAPGDDSAVGTSWADLITGDTTYSAAPTTKGQITADIATCFPREQRTGAGLRRSRDLQKVDPCDEYGS